MRLIVVFVSVMKRFGMCFTSDGCSIIGEAFLQTDLVMIVLPKTMDYCILLTSNLDDRYLTNVNLLKVIGVVWL